MERERERTSRKGERVEAGRRSPTTATSDRVPDSLLNRSAGGTAAAGGGGNDFVRCCADATGAAGYAVCATAYHATVCYIPS